MNGDDVEHWSQEHFARLALYRTVGMGVNIFLSLILIAKLFEWV